MVVTKNYRKAVIKEEGIEDKCRRCGSTGETIQYILNGCAQLLPEEYKKRHVDVGRILHLKLKKNRINMGREQNRGPDPPYNKYTPEPVIETETHVLCWDRTIKTDRETPCNRPDITV